MKDDTISRQAAIDTVSRGCQEFRGIFAECEKNLNALPAVQPEIIRCKDCKHADDDGVCQNSMGLVIQDDDDFCSYAERRTDGTVTRSYID